MNRFASSAVAVVVMLLVGGVALAETESSGYEYMPPQPFHQPVSPWPVEFGHWQDHSSTAAEGYMRGRAAVIQAWGNYELSRSQAEISWQQAAALDRENALRRTQAFRAQREMWQKEREDARKARDERIVDGQLKQAERRATVHRQAYKLTTDELNLATGAIQWPAVLQASEYQADRERVEELFRAFVGYGDPQRGAADEIGRSVERLTRALRSDVASVPRGEYYAAQKFLRGLGLAAEEVAGNGVTAGGLIAAAGR